MTEAEDVKGVVYDERVGQRDESEQYVLMVRMVHASCLPYIAASSTLHYHYSL